MGRVRVEKISNEYRNFTGLPEGWRALATNSMELIPL
jgi:hypothetical protein